MLQLRKVSKRYVTGELIQNALDDVSLSLRRNEFVAVLGPSGSGKTTLLNIIGGLDRYDEGDLIINGISTKEYSDRDWDAYRNHAVGFVFQSYNLIPHQNILANVELALTISGISRAERRRRAREALVKVGLGDQLHKRPNQMSGGQVQRVAIARALVNDPDILLADEPTGALDSETSVQVLDLLKEVARDRLVVMVTHNAELAGRYATRIVKLRDGRVIADSDPYEAEDAAAEQAEGGSLGKASMSFTTSLSLSFNNLLTKRGRTLLTAFAGSIGIIGIALILALSSGVNDYIADIQKETMSSYPLTISAQALDVEGMMASRQGFIAGRMDRRQAREGTDRSQVYSNSTGLEAEDAMAFSIAENDLTAFKKYLDSEGSDIREHIGENGIIYTYDVRFDVYAADQDGQIINTSADPDEGFGFMPSFGGRMGSMSSAAGFGAMNSMFSAMPALLSGAALPGAANFSELMPGAGGDVVSRVVTDSYDLLYGRWPSEADELILVLDRSNALPTGVLYQLGLISQAEYRDIQRAIKDKQPVKTLSWPYEALTAHRFSLVPSSDYYAQEEDGSFRYVADDAAKLEALVANGITLKIVGIIRPIPDAVNATIPTALGYTSQLTDRVIRHTDASAVAQAQRADPALNVLTGLPFQMADDAAKIAAARGYLAKLSGTEQMALSAMLRGRQAADENETERPSLFPANLFGPGGLAGGALDDQTLLKLYDSYLSGGSYRDNLAAFGVVSYDAPYAISIYTDLFEDKDAVAAGIAHYNETVGEDERITYTDYVALLTSSITSIVNVISYILIAFVAVSLVVSCIMIGVITHISVLERTKEIGILRAIGASRRNIAQVFNAETVIIGLFSGALGVIVSWLLILPINAIIHRLSGSETVRATLSLPYALALVLISMVITVIGGLLPARKAARKDPVIALRTE